MIRLQAKARACPESTPLAPREVQPESGRGILPLLKFIGAHAPSRVVVRAPADNTPQLPMVDFALVLMKWHRPPACGLEGFN